MEGELEILDKQSNKWNKKFCFLDDESFCISNSLEEFEKDNIIGEVHLEILKFDQEIDSTFVISNGVTEISLKSENTDMVSKWKDQI